MATVKATIKKKTGTTWDEIRPKTEVAQIVDFAANVPTSLNGLTDVDTATTAPSSGDSLVFNGSLWVPGEAGGGDVQTVNGVSPDANGEVTLSASDVGALDLTGDTMNGPLVIETNSDQNQGLFVSRTGTNQALRIYTNDSVSYIDAIQDENTGEYGSIAISADMEAPSSWVGITGNEIRLNGDTKVNGNTVWHEGNFEPNVDTLDVLPTYSASDESFIKYNTTERAVEVQSSSDTSIGAVYPAFRVYPGAKYHISFQMKASAAATDGLYFRMQEYDAQIPNGKTHIASSATHPEVQEDTRQVTSFLENTAIGTSWENHAFVYTPTATAQWASAMFLNWTGLGTNSLFIKNLKITAVNESADSLSGLTSSQFLRSDADDTMTGNLRIESGSFASLILDREGDTSSSSVVQFENNNGTIGGIGGFGNDGLQFRTKDGTVMVIDAENQVGIGTTSPAAKLQVAGTGTGEFAGIFGADVTGGGLTNSTRKFSRIGMPHYTNSQAPFSLITGDSDGTNNTVYVGGGTSAGNAATQIRFATAANTVTAAGTDRVIIDSSGNVGIGTTSPGSRLHILSPIEETITVDVSTNTGGIHFKESGTFRGLFGFSNGTSMWTGADDHDMVWRSEAKAHIVSNTSQHGITVSSGNVGIGTTSPNEKLTLPYGSKIGWEYSNSDSNVYHTIGKSANGGGALEFKQGWTTGDSSIYSFFGSPGGNETELLTIRNNGSVGIGTTSPTEKLDVNGNIIVSGDNRYMTFGTPGAGTTTGARFVSIEGNTDANGEGSGRIFFTEHNSSTAGMDSYGMSIGYRGGDTSIIGASGNTWTGLSQIANGAWGMWGHDNSADGALIMYGDRAATYVNFAGNDIQGVENMYVGSYIYHNDDTNTYIRFVGADDMQLVAGGRQMLRMAEGTDPDRLRFVTDSDWTDSSGNWNMSGTVTVGGNLDVVGSIYDNDANLLRIIKPKGGAFQGGSSHTGAIGITLPAGTRGSATMMSMFVDVYDYAGGSDGESWTLQIGGYNYTGSQWYNVFANLVSGRSDRFFNVKFSHDAGSGTETIWIGENTSNWSYPQIQVRDIIAGHSGGDDADWVNNPFNVTIGTIFGSVTMSKDAENYASDSLRLQGYVPVESAGANSIAKRNGDGDLTVTDLIANGVVTAGGNKLAWVRTQGTTYQAGVNFTLSGSTLYISTSLT